MFFSKSWIWEVSLAGPLSASQAFFIARNPYCSRDIYSQCSQNHRSVKLAAKRNSSGCQRLRAFSSAGNTALLINLSGRSLSLPKIFIGHLFIKRVDFGTEFSSLSISSTHFLTHWKSGSKPCAFLICHELVIKSQSHTVIIITIIPRATLHVMHTFTSNSFVQQQIKIFT